MTRETFLRLLKIEWPTDVRIDRDARTIEGTFPSRKYKVMYNGQSYTRTSCTSTFRFLDVDDAWFGAVENVLSSRS